VTVGSGPMVVMVVVQICHFGHGHLPILVLQVTDGAVPVAVRVDEEAVAVAEAASMGSRAAACENFMVTAVMGMGQRRGRLD
jgi:hypothetical protein